VSAPDIGRPRHKSKNAANMLHVVTARYYFHPWKASFHRLPCIWAQCRKIRQQRYARQAFHFIRKRL